MKNYPESLQTSLFVFTLGIFAFLGSQLVFGQTYVTSSRSEDVSGMYRQAKESTEILLARSNSDRNVGVARARKEMVKKLMVLDRAKFQKLLITPPERRALSSDVRAYVERQVRCRGKLMVARGERSRDSSGVLTEAAIEYQLLSEGEAAVSSCGKKNRLLFDHDPHLSTGESVEVVGWKIDDTIAAAAPGNGEIATDQTIRSARGNLNAMVSVVTATPLSAFYNTKGERTVAVFLVNFSEGVEPWTTQEVHDRVFTDVNQFFLENSYQQMWLTGDVFGWYTVSGNPSSSLTACKSQGISDQVDQAAAQAHQVDVSDYDHVIYVFPPEISACKGKPWADISGYKVWLSRGISVFDIAHEMTHNIGSRHSYSLTCEDDSTMHGTGSILNSHQCGRKEYGDMLDTMGGVDGTTGLPHLQVKFGEPHFNAIQKDRLGWLGRGASPEILHVSTSGEYTIDAYETPGKAPKALKFQRPGENSYFYVEHRTQTGFDTPINDDEHNGVLLHYAEARYDGNHLIDLTPRTPTVRDASLLPGSTFSDPLTGTDIHLVESTSAQARIRVTFKPIILSPAPDSAIPTSTATFQWSENTVSGIQKYWLRVGTLGPNSKNLYSAMTTDLSATVTNLPIDGSTIYVSLLWKVNGSWDYVNRIQRYVFTASEPKIISPKEGDKLLSTTQTFEWLASNAVDQWKLEVGTSQGSQDVFDSGSLNPTKLSQTVSGIPLGGQSVWVRLSWLVDGTWEYRDSEYLSLANPGMTVPAPGTTLPEMTTFKWAGNGTNVQEWWLYVGTSKGAKDLFNSGALASNVLQKTVSHLPTNGAAIWVRLWWKVGSGWQSSDLRYEASVAFTQASPALTHPEEGTQLSGATETFKWVGNGTNVQEWWFYVGTSKGAKDLFNSGALASNVLQKTVSHLPTNGAAIWVRLWWKVGSGWQSSDLRYEASVAFTQASPALTHPEEGTQLSGATETFKWVGNGTNVQEWWFYVGTSKGAKDLFNSGALASNVLQKTVSHLPTNGAAIWVRLWWKVGSTWNNKDFSYAS